MGDELVNGEETCQQEIKQEVGPKKKRTLPAAAEPYKFKPGQSGNPSGRPKKKWLTEAFEEMLERKLADPKEREAFIEAYWQKLLSRTVVSSMTLEKVLDRTEGKLTQPVDVGGEVDIVHIIEEGRKRLG